MTEWEFLQEVAEKADCGILLDVNNIYVSSKNHEFNVLDYLNGLDLSRVGQIHLAGHRDFGSYLLDTHDQPVCDPVWELYAELIRRIGPTNTLLEWDANIPTFEEVYQEASKAEKFLQSSSKSVALKDAHVEAGAE